MEQIRLDRFLANNGCGTRNEVKKLLRQGLVRCNDEVVKDPARKISPEKDQILCAGKKVNSLAGRVLMLNKSAGYITATSDSRMPTVMDLIGKEVPEADSLFPVGRLDRDTEGLLLMMDDGELAHRLLAPSWHVEKEYEAVVSGMIGEKEIRAFAEGLEIGDGEPTLPAVLEIIGTAAGTETDVHQEVYQDVYQEVHQDVYQDDVYQDVHQDFVRDACRTVSLDGQRCRELLERLGKLSEQTVTCVRVRIREGRYHQIKRMFEAVGSRVLYLRRTAMGPVHLDESLSPGQYRLLSEEEINDLRKCTGLK